MGNYTDEKDAVESILSTAVELVVVGLGAASEPLELSFVCRSNSS